MRGIEERTRAEVVKLGEGSSGVVRHAHQRLDKELLDGANFDDQIRKRKAM